MRITFLAEKLNRTGGSSFSLNLLANRLSNRGHTVTVLTTNFFSENNIPNEIEYTVVDDVPNSSSRYSGFPQIKRTLERYESQTDVYHIFNPQHLPIAGLYRRSGNTPTVGRLNAYDVFCTNPGMMDGECHKNCSLLNKVRHDTSDTNDKVVRVPQYAYHHFSPQFINYLDRLFAISPAIKEVYSKNKINKELIDVIPNCYDPDFTQGSDADLDIPSNNFEILYVGRLRVEKGVDLLVDAAEHLDMSDKLINIVGDGTMRDDLERKVTNAGLGDSIYFHGWVDQSELPNYYLHSDIFVHPGRWPEPFGRTILEALQCDCPPVVSDIGGPPWVIGDAGKTFVRGDSKDLSAAIKEIYNSSDLLKYKLNCSKIVERFDPELVISTIESKYETVNN